MTYYDPGTSDFYYNKMCTNGSCFIVQVARSCNCYVSGIDQQLYYLTFEDNATLEGSTFNYNARIPPAAKHSVKVGKTLTAISEYYGIKLAMLLAANPEITNPDRVQSGQVINIPAQAYTVVDRDNLDSIARAYGVPLSALVALNNQIENPDPIVLGQLTKVPAQRLGDPFCTTVEPGDSLSSIADTWNMTLPSIEAVNPLIENMDLIFPNQIVNVSMYLPVQGNITSQDSCPTCEMDEKAATTLTGAKFAMVTAIPAKMVTTTIEVGPTATPIVAKAPAPTAVKRSVDIDSWVGKGECRD